jgi:hypothetical protein
MNALVYEHICTFSLMCDQVIRMETTSNLRVFKISASLPGSLNKIHIVSLYDYETLNVYRLSPDSATLYSRNKIVQNATSLEYVAVVNKFLSVLRRALCYKPEGRGFESR